MEHNVKNRLLLDKIYKEMFWKLVKRKKVYKKTRIE